MTDINTLSQHGPFHIVAEGHCTQEQPTLNACHPECFSCRQFVAHRVERHILMAASADRPVRLAAVGKS